MSLLQIMLRIFQEIKYYDVRLFNKHYNVHTKIKI